MNAYAHILPEICQRRRPEQEPFPGFPETCPACGSPKTDERPRRSASYACGAAYTEKGQIQNHTDKWWGSCPVTKAKAS